MSKELLEFVKENRQAIADLAKVPPPIIEKSLFSDISEQMYDVMAGVELEMFNGNKWVDDIHIESVKDIKCEEDDYYMSEEYMETTKLTPDIVKEYVNKHDPQYVVCGEEFNSIFITDVNHPPLIANWMTWNDLYFFSSKIHSEGQAREYEVNGKKLYITWGIADPGT